MPMTFSQYDDPTGVYTHKASTGGYIFKSEAEARERCAAWNEWAAAMDTLDSLPNVLTRTDYENVCQKLNAPLMTDADCGNYGVQFGDFGPWEYTAEYCVKMALAKRRLREIEAAKIAPEPISRPYPPKKTGQLWEECPHCGSEPVYMPLNLCGACWPK